MPPPLSPTLSVEIRRGLRGILIVPPFNPENLVGGQGVAGIPQAGTTDLLRYGAAFEYALPVTCPDVIDMQTTRNGRTVAVSVTLSGAGVCALAVLNKADSSLLFSQVSLRVTTLHDFNINLPLGDFRIIALGGSVPLEDTASPQNVFNCNPEVIDLIVDANSRFVTLRAQLAGIGGVLAFVMEQATGIVMTSVYIPANLAMHETTFDMPATSFRLLVFAVGPIVEDV